MAKCSFSGKEIPPGTGIMYVKKDGKVLWFANRKAEKNYLMGRRARMTRWTEYAREAKKSTGATVKEQKEKKPKAAPKATAEDEE